MINMTVTAYHVKVVLYISDATVTLYHVLLLFVVMCNIFYNSFMDNVCIDYFIF